MKPTDLLKEEHHGVKLALRVLEKLCEGIGDKQDAKSAVYTDDLIRLIDFFRVFVDKCHHAKEEDVLFPALIEAGLPREGGPVQVMLAEHAAGRKLVADMDGALKDCRSGTLGAVPALIEAAKGYANLLTEHISKEDNVLYPIADARIPADIQAGMMELFEKIEVDRIGLGTHERFHDMLKEFKSTYLVQR